VSRHEIERAIEELRAEDPEAFAALFDDEALADLHEIAAAVAEVSL
jgi:hypothetical protein